MECIDNATWGWYLLTLTIYVTGDYLYCSTYKTPPHTPTVAQVWSTEFSRGENNVIELTFSVKVVTG